MTLIWVLLTFGLAVCWAATILVNKRVLDSVTPLGVNLLVRVATLPVLAALTLTLTLGGIWDYGFGIDLDAALWIALNAVVTWLVAFNAYYYALRGGSVGVVAPIIGTDPLWTAVFAALALGAAFGPVTVVGLLVAMAGVTMLSRWTTDGPPEGNPEVLAGAPAPGESRRALVVVALAVLTAAGWGLNPVLIELAVNAYGEPSATMMLESQALGLLFLAALLVWRRSAVFTRRLSTPERRRAYALIAAAGVLEAFFGVGFYLAIAEIGSLLTALILASSPVFSLAGGVVFLRERIGWKLTVGAGVTVAGVTVATLERLF